MVSITSGSEYSGSDHQDALAVDGSERLIALDQDPPFIRSWHPLMEECTACLCRQKYAQMSSFSLSGSAAILNLVGTLPPLFGEETKLCSLEASTGAIQSSFLHLAKLWCFRFLLVFVSQKGILLKSRKYLRALSSQKWRLNALREIAST